MKIPGRGDEKIDADEFFESLDARSQRELAGSVVYAGLASDNEDYNDIQSQLNRYEQQTETHGDVIEELEALIKADRKDDELLLIERTLHPRAELPMRKDAA